MMDDDDMPPLVDQSWQHMPRPDHLGGPWPAAPPQPVWPQAGPVQQGPWGPNPVVGFAPLVPAPIAGLPPWAAPAAPAAAYPPNDAWAYERPPRATTPYRSLSTRSHTPFDSPRSDSSHLSSHHNHHHHLSRSRSFGGSVQERHKRPPREWRPNFSMIRPSGLEGAISSLFRSRSLSGVEPGSIPKVALSQYLRYSAAHHPMSLDVRGSPESVVFAELGRPTDVQWDLVRYACEPPLPVMVLGSDYYPWLIEARASNPTGVTLHDLLLAVWTSMMAQISTEDYWNLEMSEVARDHIARAYDVRCGNDAMQRGAGIRRVDYLMGRVLLKGLVRLKDGSFEMKLKFPEP